jgi:hypothetical protein
MIVQTRMLLLSIACATAYLHASGHAGIAALPERHLDDMRNYPMSASVVLHPHRASDDLGYKLEYPHSEQETAPRLCQHTDSPYMLLAMRLLIAHRPWIAVHTTTNNIVL